MKNFVVKMRSVWARVRTGVASVLNVASVKGLAFGLVVMLLGASLAFAQTSPESGKRWSVSFRQGLQVNSLALGEGWTGNWHNRLGFNEGLLVGYNFSRFIGAQSGLLLTTRGVKQELYNDYSSGIAIYELQLPLQAVLTVPFGEEWAMDWLRLKVHAGPTVGYGLSARRTNLWEMSENGWMDSDMYADGLLQRFNFGLGFGLGVEIVKFYVGLGYDLGLSDLAEGEAVDGNDTRVRTRSWTFNAGYRF